MGTYPKYSILKGEVGLTSRRIPDLLMEIQDRYSDGEINAVDGVRVDYPGKWFHVRVSQTEPVVRVICEQKGQAPTALFHDLMEMVRSYV